MKSPAAHRVREKRQLLPRPSWGHHQMKLRCLCKPRGDKHLALRGMPIGKIGASIRPVSPRRLCQGRRNLRHSVHHKIIRRREIGILGASGQRQEDRNCEQQANALHLGDPLSERRGNLFIHYQSPPREHSCRLPLIFSLGPNSGRPWKKIASLSSNGRNQRSSSTSWLEEHLSCRSAAPVPLHAKLSPRSLPVCSRKS